VRRRVGQQRHVPRVLQRNPQATLVARASSSLAPWLDLAAIGEIAVQPRDIFIVDLDYMIDTECTNLAATWPTTTTTKSPTATESRPITTIPISVAKS